MFDFGPSDIGFSGLGFFVIAYSIAILVVHIIMALAVNEDAKRLIADHTGLFLFGPLFWGIIVFVFGLAGLAVYWAIHHSSLRSNKPPSAR